MTTLAWRTPSRGPSLSRPLGGGLISLKGVAPVGCSGERRGGGGSAVGGRSNGSVSRRSAPVSVTRTAVLGTYFGGACGRNEPGMQVAPALGAPFTGDDTQGLGAPASSRLDRHRPLAYCFTKGEIAAHRSER